MRNAPYTLLLLCALSLMSCMRQSSMSDRQLAAADAIMLTRPDSSLVVLNAIDTACLSIADRAHYALLMSKARNKNDIFEDSDTLIRMAFDYYQGAGDILEVQAGYYEGGYLSRQEKYADALYVLTESYDKAVAISDWFYAGMCARELAQVNKMILYPADELKWAQTAKQMFERSDHPVHATWMDLTIAWALIYNGRSNDALQLIQTVDNSLLESNSYFRHQILLAQIEAFYHCEMFENVIRIFDQLRNDGYVMDAYDYIKLSDALLKNGNADDAQEYLSLATDLPMEVSDSLYYEKIVSQILATTGDYKAAYEHAMSWGESLMKKDEKLLTNPQTALVAENYRLKSLLQKSNMKRTHVQFICYVAASVIILLLLVIILRSQNNKLERKNILIDQYIKEADNLKYDLNKSIDRLANSKNKLEASQKGSQYLESQIEEIKTTNAKEKLRFKDELHRLFSMHISALNKICGLRYIDTIKEDLGPIYRKDVLKSIEEIKKIDIMQELVDIINHYDDNWMEMFRKSCPNITEKEYRLAIYLYVGFQTETIMVLMDKTNTQTVHIAKHKLKKKIMDNCSNDTEKILNRLHMTT